MRARSWMALLALVVGTSIALVKGVPAEAPGSPPEQGGDQSAREAQPPAQADKPRQTDTHIPLARLNLLIAGLGPEGCDVRVKPGNASCKFRTLNSKGAEDSQHVPADGRATVELRDIELRGADRTCTVAITVQEPGHEQKTVYRGFRLPNRAGGKGPPAAAPVFTCYLSSPSKLARADQPRAQK